MVLQSHNSWSYLRPKKWYLRLISFMARCQRVSIRNQYYSYNVRSFDLRIRFGKYGNLIVAHGIFQYDITLSELLEDLKFLNDREDCSVRIIHEVRNRKQYTRDSIRLFQDFCERALAKFPKIKFYSGKNLYNYSVDFDFDYNPTETGKYSSVMKPLYIDDWFPWLYARLNNRDILKTPVDTDILSIDFVDIR